MILDAQMCTNLDNMKKILQGVCMSIEKDENQLTSGKVSKTCIRTKHFILYFDHILV